MENTEKMNQAEKLALDVLRLSRNTLLVNLRFLDMALSRLRFFPSDAITLMTDGERLLFNAVHVLKSYKAEKERPIRDYFHIVLHCVYRHMFLGVTIDRVLWDLSCDVAVENVITELGLSSTAAKREVQQAQEIAKLKQNLKLLTAEKIYAYYSNQGLSPSETERLRALFCADDHEIWYMTDKQAAAKYGSPSSPDSPDKDNGDSSGSGDPEKGESKEGKTDSSGAGDSEQENTENDASRAGMVARRSVSDEWKDIAERMQQDLETFSKLQGDKAGSMMQNLASVTREKYDYTEFLKKFAVIGEAMKINDDEFDYIFYTYGLQLYKKMPLVEPLEYKEVKRIREFVIAIDTSGSTSGPLVQKFVQKTYNILKSTESFFTKINLHIVQCDANIQEHVKITSRDEFDEYLKTMRILGLGGTDFRPVFTLVDELIKQGEFGHLNGLIYFTDGYGTFPERKPDYRTAFVFAEDDYTNPDVPPWAIKLVLPKEDI